MIKFLLKGLLRDKSRSRTPIIVVSLGVALTVIMSSYIHGALGDVTDQNARFETGHVKIMSKAYDENKEQMPNDLALLGVNALVSQLQKEYPSLNWVERIRFGGLIDVMDGKGGSKGQGPTSGLAINLLDKNSGEIERLNIENALKMGSLPTQSGEVLLGHDFAQKMNIKLGDTLTYFGSTMNGSMTFQNFIIRGTVRFGVGAMDRAAMLMDIRDAQQVLDMEDGAGELLGYFDNHQYQHEKAMEITSSFNAKYAESDDEFAPIMYSLRQQNNLEELLSYSDSMSSIMVFIFVFAMSVVLWNMGLLGGLRRYKEFGIRLALGESKGHIYRSQITEAVLIGLIGSLVGTGLGLAGAYYLQEYGIDISNMAQSQTMIMSSVIKGKITVESFFIGFIPGVLAMVLGNMLSSLGIYRRETASLFKELEV